MRPRLPLVITTALLAAAIVVPAHAQKGPMTLAEAVSMAQQHAPAQLAANAALRAADANADVAAQRPNPSLSFEAENVMGSGRYAGFGGGERTLSLEVPIELGGKRNARRRVAQAERSAVSLGVTATRAEVTQRATDAFIAVVTAERRLAVAKTGYELAEKGAHAARERVRAGKASPIEEQRAEVGQVNASVKLGKTERALALAQADLARITGSALPVSVTAGWFESVDAPRMQAEPGAQPSLARAEAEVAAASARVDAARRDRIPDVTLTVGTRRYGDSSDRAAVVGISVPLPLFNTGTAALVKTRADYDRAIAERNVVELETSQTVAHAQAELADAAALAQAANGPALVAAEEAARIARIGYAEGKFAQLELLEAERTLAQTREEALDALAAFHIAQARLAHLRGSTNPIHKD
jgi:cobalt-zinc-cadmium efflux system outer membrane protein